MQWMAAHSRMIVLMLLSLSTYHWLAGLASECRIDLALQRGGARAWGQAGGGEHMRG